MVKSNMYVGQKAVCMTKTFHEYEEDSCHKRVTMTGRISYIHPEERFIMVEFETPGGNLRECYKPMEVRLGK